MRADSKELMELWDAGARAYVCGSTALAQSVRTACIEIALEWSKAQGREPDREKAEAWFDRIRNERFSTDVFT